MVDAVLVKQAQVVEAMRQLESKLKSAGWIVVESYEWESGLD